MIARILRANQATALTHRPIGLWILAICNSVIAVVGIVRVSPGLRDPLPHAWSLTAAHWAPYVIALLLSLMIAAWLALAGSRYARMVLLGLLTLLVGLNLQEDVHGVPFLIDLAKRNWELWWRPGFWWDLSLGLRWILWLGLNYWYLLGPRTRVLYATARGG